MTRNSVTVLIAAAGLLSASGAIAQTAGDPEAGAEMAREICAECHAVELFPDVINADGPRSFAAIAGDPVYTEMSLRVFLQTPHNQMPDFIFTKQQTDDIIAYLMDMRANLPD